ncbi:MAG TPA: glycosyl transferase family 36, partial [Isosphaeraceae bacterium]|nr:glycosyl transferase family 36 [Isosphaeraceae bacterium]
MNSSYVEPSRVSTLDLAPSPVLLIDPRGEDPIRARILGLERLESHARLMARACTLAPRRRANSPLLERFVDNKRVLSWVHDQLSTRGDLHGIDAEWLVDNFHIIEDSLREVARDLPPGYDAQLPKISAPPLVGYPRVYALALALVAHTDSELDETRIVRFVSAFQESAPLTIGELWALPTMLRLVLVDNLRRLSEKMIWRWEERRRAEQWAKSALADTQGPYDEAKNKGPSQAPPPLAELSDPFVVRLLQLLRDQGPVNAAVEHLEAELSAHGSEPNEVLKREQSRQAADQVTVGNCVLSLRLLSAIDWNAFFEKSSPVEAILRDDPAGIYPRQEFATSDRYRRVVEIIARQSDADEMEVSRKAVELAVQGRGAGEPRDHVGFYLIDRGQKELKSAFRFRPTWRERLLDLVLGRPQSVYFGSIVIGLAALLALVVIFALGGGLTNFWWILAIAAAALLPISELVVGLVNQLFTLFVPPRVLPKLDVKHG